MLHVHHAERADALVTGLAEVLRVPPEDPFTPDIVAVPAKGVERWLTQRLSHALGTSAGTGAPAAADGSAGDGSAGDGICAHVHFPHPATLTGTALRAGDADAAGDQPDPWDSDRLQWTLLEVIDECAGQDWCPTLGRHLGVDVTSHTDHRRGRRLATAQHLARLFHSYGQHRPSMLLAWAAGDDTDGLDGSLPADLRWQAELWRRVRMRLATPSPAERLGPACARLRAEPHLVDLPARISLFGPTRLSAAALNVLAALAGSRDVHLWLPHPSPALWDAVSAASPAPAASGALAAAPAVAPARGSRLVRRRSDPTAEAARLPILASLGRDARELHAQLAGLAVPRTTQHHPLPPRPTTLLGRLQQAVRDDAPTAVPSTAMPALAPDDRSVQVHACHGQARQVEVLRDVVAGLLADDPTLEPRDVLVMCPDIETFAPLISANFGLDDEHADTHPGHRLRVRLADRALRQTNPVLAVLAALLDLADSRVTVMQLLDFAALPPVRRLFRFSDDDVERLREWAVTAQVRWGLDAAHRSRFQLGRVAQNTWRAGLDRILLGVAMSEEDLHSLGEVLPLDDVESNDVSLAGRFAEMVDRVSAALGEMTGERSLADWLAVLTSAVDALTAVVEADAWQPAQARREIAVLTDTAAGLAPSTLLSLPDMRALLRDVLAGRPTRANFRTGDLTMCSMVPMRSVPHRVVCLLGLDDKAFPRGSGVDGDDVLGRDPCIGERDPRSEDRQLLLDALLAAQEHLVLLYTGADPRTNTEHPPAVPVGEILDAVDALACTHDSRPARTQVITRHPLQPFDPRNFTPGRLGPDRPFSFDRHALRGAQRAGQPRGQPQPFLPAALPALPAGDVTLDDLVSFVEHPVRAFLRQRLAVAGVHEEAEPADELDAELDGLQKWAVGDRILKAMLRGAGPSEALEAERGRGTLPPGALGQRVVEEVRVNVEPLLAASVDVRRGAPDAVDVTVSVADISLTGTVSGVHGSVVVRVEYSRLNPKHRLRAWVQVLALTAAHPERRWQAVTLGRGDRGVARSVIGPVSGDLATVTLTRLVALLRRGCCEPLPMAVKTSAMYADKRRRGMLPDNALAKAKREWLSEQKRCGEQDDPSHQVVWGQQPSFDVLLVEDAGDAERGPGWPDDEPSRFGALARHLWEPLLAAESLETL